MNDKELLGFAARAAGIVVLRSRLDDPLHCDMLIAKSSRNSHHENGPWNPLADDGDVMRLAVALRLTVSIDDWKAEAWKASECGGAAREAATMGYSIEKATRRAIVRAAAEIGKAL